MKTLFLLLLVAAAFTLSCAVSCDFINFNNGELNLKNCSGNLSHLEPLVVRKFDAYEELNSRTGNETYFIGNYVNQSEHRSLCVETELYDVDHSTTLQVCINIIQSIFKVIINYNNNYNNLILNKIILIKCLL